MQVEATQCRKCHNVLFSREDGDSRSCSCGSIGIHGTDGGMTISNAWGDSRKSAVDNFILDIGDDVTPQILWEDYANAWNEWGLLRAQALIDEKRTYEISESGVVVDRNPAPPHPLLPFRKTRKKK